MPASDFDGQGTKGSMTESRFVFATDSVRSEKVPPSQATRAISLYGHVVEKATAKITKLIAYVIVVATHNTLNKRGIFVTERPQVIKTSTKEGFYL